MANGALRPPDPPRQWVVYRCYDADGELLYIGCTANLDARLAGHRAHHLSRSPWIDRLDRVETSGPYATRHEGMIAERDAILAERPTANVTFNRDAECRADGCDKVPHALGWCRPHYFRLRRYGDPYAGSEPDHPGFTSSEVLARVGGFTYRQLDYWCRTGRLTPSHGHADGSGSRRRFSLEDVACLEVVAYITSLVRDGTLMDRVADGTVSVLATSALNQEAS